MHADWESQSCVVDVVVIVSIKFIYVDISRKILVQLIVVLEIEKKHLAHMMKLGYCYVAWFFLPASVNAIPRFLLAGQSNMEGHGGVDLSVFNGTMDILLDTTVDEVISSNLKQHLSSYSSSPPTSDERYDFMAAYLLDLKNQDILTDDIHNYQADIDCSFLSLDINSPDSGPVVLAEDMPLSRLRMW